MPETLMLLAALGLLISLGLLAVVLVRQRAPVDRVVAVDALSACAIAGCLLAAGFSGVSAFIDVAIGFALVAFLGTVGWAQAIERATTARAEREPS